MKRRIVAAGLGVLIAPTAAEAQEGASEAERNWTAIAQCGAIGEAERRLDCVDRVLRQAGVLNTERVAQAARREFGRETRLEAPPPSVPERPRAVAPATPAEPAAAAAPTRSADMDELITTVASVRTVGYRRLRVTTAEGSVWEQTQAETFLTDPKPGDRFVVERAAMNSFLCRFGRASSRYRCERVD